MRPPKFDPSTVIWDPPAVGIDAGLIELITGGRKLNVAADEDCVPAVTTTC